MSNLIEKAGESINVVLDKFSDCVTQFYDTAYTRAKQIFNVSGPLDRFHIIFIDKNLLSGMNLEESYRFIDKLCIGFGDYKAFSIKQYSNITSLGGKDSGIENRAFPDNLYSDINSEPKTKSIILLFDSLDIGKDYLSRVMADSPINSIVYVKKGTMSDMQSVYLEYIMEDSHIRELS